MACCAGCKVSPSHRRAAPLFIPHAVSEDLMSAYHMPGPKLGIERGWQPAKPFLLSWRPGLGGRRSLSSRKARGTQQHPGGSSAFLTLAPRKLRAACRLFSEGPSRQRRKRLGRGRGGWEWEGAEPPLCLPELRGDQRRCPSCLRAYTGKVWQGRRRRLGCSGEGVNPCRL